jgi:hypothetical protein
VKDFGKDLDGQKFAFVALNNWRERARTLRQPTPLREGKSNASCREQIIPTAELASQTPVTVE